MTEGVMGIAKEETGMMMEMAVTGII